MSPYQDAGKFFREFDGNPEYERERAIARAQNTVGYNVNRFRRMIGLTQLELAMRAGMRQPRIAEIERGEYNPRLDTLAKLSLGLGVSLGELVRDPEETASAIVEPDQDEEPGHLPVLTA
jgi:DNA-binding XRE family transcriptional regulator